MTCTDMTVLSGNYPEVCFAKYGTMPLKAPKYVHEMSLRILLHAIDTAANRYKKHIVPWLSLSVDFYVRVFVRVYESPAEVKRSCLKRGMVYQSTQCASFYVQPLATEVIPRGKKGSGQANKAGRKSKNHEECVTGGSLSVTDIQEQNTDQCNISDSEHNSNDNSSSTSSLLRVVHNVGLGSGASVNFRERHVSAPSRCEETGGNWHTNICTIM